jgi:hypothetical protein
LPFNEFCGDFPQASSVRVIEGIGRDSAAAAESRGAFLDHL